ncbi:hypothetical protein [Caldicellulosiruptor saccharolyticus]|uniref:hypothetical protein n=1 Tax=Caldicellulosiruptor saccharolyticus TaxID=44001 RepID=UPI0002E4AF52|nr:hypothetical protein [Caldicellulosiruptor saccharolyticus]
MHNFEIKEITKGSAACVHTLVNLKGRKFLMQLLDKEPKVIELKFGERRYTKTYCNSENWKV